MRMQDVFLHLLVKQPFYGYVSASVTPCENSGIKTVRMVAAPVPRLLYNREWFESLKPEHAVGIVMHELLHLVLLHPFRRESRDELLWAAACDMAVNEHIAPEMLPLEAITVNKIARETRESIPASRSAEFYYGILSKNDGNVSFLTTDNEIRVLLKSGQELKANPCSEDGGSEVNKNAVKSLLSEIMQQAELEGEIPGEMETSVAEVYKSGEINWRNVLKRFLTGRGKVMIRKSCKKESKRFENLPGNKRTVGTNALLAIDESGSISDRQVIQFHTEMCSINRITGASLYVTQFDTECTPPIPIQNYVRGQKRVKSGGTDFRPVFELADKMRIPLLIIFTDGDGTVPESANQMVLWVLTKGGKKPAAFGHSITLELQGEEKC